MNLGTIVTWSFFISLVLVLVGAFMKILHLPGAEQLLIVGMVTNGVFRHHGRYRLFVAW